MNLRNRDRLGEGLPGVDFRILIDRALSQRSMLERRHEQAARDTFGTQHRVAQIEMREPCPGAARDGVGLDAIIDESQNRPSRPAIRRRTGSRATRLLVDRARLPNGLIGSMRETART
jgi:hypothetical protein